jgi:hypothetical protein
VAASEVLASAVLHRGQDELSVGAALAALVPRLQVHIDQLSPTPKPNRSSNNLSIQIHASNRSRSRQTRKYFNDQEFNVNLVTRATGRYLKKSCVDWDGWT